jgi:hypothetical protein
MSNARADVVRSRHFRTHPAGDEVALVRLEAVGKGEHAVLFHSADEVRGED